ncbi:hypothetical protein RCH13_001626 [Chryseobacterium sp. MP_3.2]|nr:hypothetical protein [Chryseobacterium sp. MP_3.2]
MKSNHNYKIWIDANKKRIHQVNDGFQTQMMKKNLFSALSALNGANII